MQLKKNDEIQLNITALTSEGSAIGRKDGVPIFVRGGVPGDVVTAHIIKAKKNYAVARLQQVLEPSPHRVESDCPVSAQCGGCAFRTVDYAEELRFKQQRIDDAFQRIGHLDLQVEGVLAAPDTVRYRNKAQYPVQLQDGRPVAGFYAYKSHRVVPTGDCLLQCTDFSAGVAACLQWAEEYQISVYNEETGTGLLRHLYFRKGQATGQVLACIVINGTDLPGGDALCAALRAAVPGLVGVVLNSNTRRTNVILGDRDRVLWGKGELLDKLCGKTFAIGPHAFYQVNHDQCERLYALAGDFAGLTGDQVLLDLYCGVGTIGLTLADRCRRLIGVEVVPQAVENARENARRNGIENAEFLCADAAGAATQLASQGVRPDVAIVDPPRKGCAPEVFAAIDKMGIERLVYVSCDPATLARDLALLATMGYTARRACGVDLFPRTPHVETVVMLSHKKPDSVINVKVEFGEGEGKVPLDNIAKRAEAYKPKERVTYKMIKEYIEAKYGFKVHTAYIAEVKRDLGLPMYDAPNAVEELKQPRKHPTAEKVEAIKDALKHFEVI